MADSRKGSDKRSDTNGLQYPDHKPIGRIIAEAREGAGWEQDDAARAVNIHPQTLSKYERGVLKKVPAEVLRALAVLYKANAAAWLNEAAGKSQSAELLPVTQEPKPGDFRVVVRTSGIVREWLLDYRAELGHLLSNEAQEEEAYSATVDLAAAAYAVGGSNQEWKPADSLRVLKAARKRVRRMLGFDK